MGEFVGLFVQQGRGLGDDPGAVRIGGLAPHFIGRLGGREFGFELRVGDLVEALDQLAVEGVEALVGHCGSAFWLVDGSRRPPRIGGRLLF